MKSVLKALLPSALVRQLRRLRDRKLAWYGPTRVFTDIYRKNLWDGVESRSGRGSDLDNTECIRLALPAVLAEFGVTSLLDAPCGDFHWMQHVDLRGVRYVGGDIVAALIADNQRRFGRPDREFRTLDITKDELPHVDLVFCRDCFFHLSFADIRAAIRNFQRSGAAYLMATTLEVNEPTVDIPSGSFRPLNLMAAPLLLPKPLRLVRENEPTKQMGLWRLSDIPEL